MIRHSIHSPVEPRRSDAVAFDQAVPARGKDRVASPDAATVAAAKATIQNGSKSFAIAARLFDPTMRADAVLLYAWCRCCDDVIDGQSLGFAAEDLDVGTPAERLSVLRAKTVDALRGTSSDPVFAAFGGVMRRHAIPERLAFGHLDGFAMDVSARRYESLDDTLSYCYAVAGIVGVMMAHIMGARDLATVQRACDLGIAFQLTNIARDIVDDAAIGRNYCPEAWLAESGIPLHAVADPWHRAALARVAARLVAAAEPYYASAAIGLRSLPLRAAWAIATASGVYRAIGIEVVQRGPRAWNERVSTSTAQKLGHVAKGAALATASRFGSRTEPRAGLYTHD